VNQIELYEKYHNDPAFHNLGSATYKGDIVKKIYGNKITTILDFGCDSGFAVRKFRKIGYQAFGYEYSKVAFDKYLKEPIFYNDINKIHDTYDMIYSTDVLEHIPEEDIPDVLDNLFHLCNKYVFMTISLRPSSNNNAYHCTLKSRNWWNEKFNDAGFQKDQDTINLVQKRGSRSTKKILSQWNNIGKFGKMFSANPPYELNGEEQPWFFVYKKNIPAANIHSEKIKRIFIVGTGRCGTHSYGAAFKNVNGLTSTHEKFPNARMIRQQALG